eukprot:752093-Hanusia_phi.AAC.2
MCSTGIVEPSDVVTNVVTSGDMRVRRVESDERHVPLLTIAMVAAGVRGEESELCDEMIAHGIHWGQQTNLRQRSRPVEANLHRGRRLGPQFRS